MYEVSKLYFLVFLGMATADTHALFVPLKPAAERGGERLCGDSSADPYPGSLEALLGE